MNNEQQQIIDEAYKNYVNWWEYDDNSVNLSDKESEKWLKLVDGGLQWGVLSQEEFINKCKTDNEFSEKWGLKIEERELSIDEKEWQLEKTNCINDIENDRIIYGHEWEKYIQEQYEGIKSNQGINIPTKLITITYKEQTTESYG